MIIYETYLMMLTHERHAHIPLENEEERIHEYMQFIGGNILKAANITYFTDYGHKNFNRGPENAERLHSMIESPSGKLFIQKAALNPVKLPLYVPFHSN